MPAFLDVFLCALLELVLCVCVGLPVARGFVTGPRLALALAPVLGWAVFSALALPLLSWLGFARVTVAFLCGSAVFAGVAALLVSRPWRSLTGVGGDKLSYWAYGAAALLAVAPALAVWPKLGGGGLVLADPLFDHSKIAIVNDIVRF